MIVSSAEAALIQGPDSIPPEAIEISKAFFVTIAVIAEAQRFATKLMAEQQQRGLPRPGAEQ